MPAIVIELTWLPSKTAKRLEYVYPLNHLGLSRGPAVYRWAFSAHEGKARFRVGQTGNLRQRVSDYLNSTTPAHKNIRKVFNEHRSNGGKVYLETLQFEEFRINGLEFSMNRLSDLFVRGVLENLVCALLQTEGFELLNETSDRRSARRSKRWFRQGTASAVPNKMEKEGGFSR